EDGTLFYPAVDPQLRHPGVDLAYHHSGMLGDTVTVNGVAWPYCEVDAALYRLRVVNASNARRYRLHLDPPPPGGGGLVQIGSDLGLLHRPVRHDDILVSPGSGTTSWSTSPRTRPAPPSTCATSARSARPATSCASTWRGGRATTPASPPCSTATCPRPGRCAPSPTAPSVSSAARRGPACRR